MGVRNACEHTSDKIASILLVRPNGVVEKLLRGGGILGYIADTTVDGLVSEDLADISVEV